MVAGIAWEAGGVEFILDSEGEAHPTWHLTDVRRAARTLIRITTYAGGRSEYDGGKMDGWLRTMMNDVFCIGYYEEAGSARSSVRLARNFTTL